MGYFKEIMRDARQPIIRTVGTIASFTGKARRPDGRWLDVHPGMNGIDYTGIYRGRYEAAETQILKEYFVPDSTIIEIGANIGFVSCAAFENKLLDGGTLYCIEANPLAYPILKSNLKRAQSFFPNRKFEVIESAIGSPAQEGKTLNFNIRSDLTSGLGETTNAKQDKAIVEVPVIALSSVVAKYAPNGYSLVCDAEGAEITVINEDPSALANCRQIAMELHHPDLTGRPETPIDIIKKIEALGFGDVKQIKDTYYFRR